MCDYSLQRVRSRPAKTGDKLVTKDFGIFTRGFASVDDLDTAVCVLPGTELAFAREMRHADERIVSVVKDWFTQPPSFTAVDGDFSSDFSEADKGTSPFESWPHLELKPFIQHMVQEDVREAR